MVEGTRELEEVRAACGEKQWRGCDLGYNHATPGFWLEAVVLYHTTKVLPKKCQMRLDRPLENLQPGHDTRTLHIDAVRRNIGSKPRGPTCLLPFIPVLFTFSHRSGRLLP